MRWLRPSRLSPIGLDLGARSIKLVQARASGLHIDIVAAATIHRPPDAPFDAAAASLVRDVLRRRGFAGNRLVVGAPMASIRIESLELPPGGAASSTVRKIAGVELGRITRLRPGSFEHAVWDLPALARGGAATHVMAVALPHADADAVIDPLVDAGLDVLALCPLPNALNAFAAAAAGPEGDETVHAVIDIGWDAARLIIGQGPRLLYYRTLHDVGLGKLRAEFPTALASDLPDDVAEHLLRNVGLSPDAPLALSRLLHRAIDAILHELKLTHAYIGHRYQHFAVGGLFLSGGGAAIPGLPELISEALGQDALLLAPPAADNAPSAPHLAAALAAALHGQEDCA